MPIALMPRYGRGRLSLFVSSIAAAAASSVGSTAGGVGMRAMRRIQCVGLAGREGMRSRGNAPARREKLPVLRPRRLGLVSNGARETPGAQLAPSSAPPAATGRGIGSRSLVGPGRCAVAGGGGRSRGGGRGRGALGQRLERLDLVGVG